MIVANRKGGGLLLLAVIAGAFYYSSQNDPATTGRYVRPVDGTLTSRFGARWGITHYGIDIAAPTGTPIRAVTAGRVIEAGPASGFGLWMRLRHDDGTVTVYGHMHTIDKPAGARVAAGERIATVGSRGQSTGPHLHLEVWPGGRRADRVDPQVWLARHGVDL